MLGSWTRALVTGASTGIGRAFAELLAHHGSNLVVVARSEERLSDLAREVGHAYGSDVEVLTADLSTSDGLEAVAERLGSRDRPCDLLVNNAGFGVSGTFFDSALDAVMGQVDVNVRAVVRLTHAALERMVEEDTGGVVNVSSTAGFFPGPGDAVYSAAKAFVINFGLGVAEELRSAGSGVRISTLCPGFTRTEFQERGGFETGGIPDVFWHDAEEVAHEALMALEKGRTVCIPGIHNRVMAAAVQVSPRTLQARLVSGLSRRLRI